MPVCRKRPFTTHADRLRPRSQRRTAPSCWTCSATGRGRRRRPRLPRHRVRRPRRPPGPRQLPDGAESMTGTVRLTRAQVHRLIETYGYSGPGGSPAGVVECRGGGASWPASKINARILCVSAWCSRTALTGSTAAITASRRATRSSFAATASTPPAARGPKSAFGTVWKQRSRSASACRKRPFTTHADRRQRSLWSAGCSAAEAGGQGSPASPGRAMR